MDISSMSMPFILSQLVLGLINGGFYAVLALGLAVIFGLLGVVNFAHGTMYMLGAYVTWIGSEHFGLSFWHALWVAPLTVGALGALLERSMLRRVYSLDPLYGLLLTFGLTLTIEGAFRSFFGVSGQSYSTPEVFHGSLDFGFMRLPAYRAAAVLFSITVCFVVWVSIEKTRLGSRLRAATENPGRTQALGINVPAYITAIFGLGSALAALAGVVASPIIQITPLMGGQVIIILFAIVVIGGMGSILGAAITGLALGLLEGVTRLVYPEASTTVIFVAMVIVLLLKPAGLFGRE
jgi:branched-chain amino acid transport system permease protein